MRRQQSLTLTKKEEEFRAEAERLKSLQLQLQLLREERQLKMKRVLDRERKRIESRAAVQIQRIFRKFLRKKKNVAAVVIREFLSTALSVRALNVAVWAASTITQFSKTACKKWKASLFRKRVLEEEKETKFLTNLMICRTVQMCVDSAIERVISTLLEKEIHANSFFLTQQRREEEHHQLEYDEEDYDEERSEDSVDYQEKEGEGYRMDSNEHVINTADLKIFEDGEKMNDKEKERRRKLKEIMRQTSHKMKLQKAKLDEESARKEKSTMALRTALVQLQSEQRARAHQFALVQRDRDALLQKRRDEEKREAEDRRREGRQMQLEDNIQRLRKRRLPRRHASSSSSSSVHSTLSDGSINKNCYKEIEKEVIECVERKIVFHQPVGVLNKLRLAALKEQELRAAEVENARLLAQRRRSEAMEREKEALKQRLSDRHRKLQLEEEKKLANEMLKEEQKMKVLQRAKQILHKVQKVEEKKEDGSLSIPRRQSIRELKEDSDTVLRQSISNSTPVLLDSSAPFLKASKSFSSLRIQGPLPPTPKAHLLLHRPQHPYAQPQVPSRSRSNSFRSNPSAALYKRNLPISVDPGSSYCSLMDLITKARLTLANTNSFKSRACDGFVESDEDTNTSVKMGDIDGKEEEDGDDDKDDCIAGKAMFNSKGPDEVDLEHRLDEECMSLLLKLQSKMLSENCNENASIEGDRTGIVNSNARSSSAPTVT